MRNKLFVFALAAILLLLSPLCVLRGERAFALSQSETVLRPEYDVFTVGGTRVENSTSPEYDLLLCDGTVTVDFILPKYFGNETARQLTLSSTNPSVAVPTTATEEEVNKNRIELNAIGSTLVTYEGTFSYLLNEETKTVSVSGGIIINVVGKTVDKITLSQDKETKVGTTVTYTAIINDNEKLTSYGRNNIVWYDGDKEIARGSTCSVTLRRATKIRAACETVSVNADTPFSFGGGNLEWLWQLILVILLLGCLILYYRINRTDPTEKAKAALNLAMQKLDKMQYSETEALKKKLLLVQINDVQNCLSLAKKNCKASVDSNELYELSAAICDINTVNEQLESIKVHLDELDAERFNRLTKHLEEILQPSYAVLLSAMEQETARRAAAKKARNNAIENEKRTEKAKFERKLKKLLPGKEEADSFDEKKILNLKSKVDRTDAED